MSLTKRLLPPPNIAMQTVMTASGRQYTSTPGNFLDVPDNLDAATLEGAGWLLTGYSGTTAQRPLPNNINATPQAVAGFKYVDTSLNALIVFDGVTWRNPVTGASV